MKKYTILFALSLLVVFAGFSQTGGQKGPAAKNYKPWKDPKQAEPVMVSVKRKDIKGPEAKNQRPLQLTSKIVVAETSAPEQKLMGPEAKNYKPWDKSRVSQVVEAEIPEVE